MRLIFKSLEHNKSLSTLAANRKNLSDEDLEELCLALTSNSYLEKLELEYNRLTCHGLKYLKDLLAVNRSLKHLSLEGNNLCSENDDSGLQALCEALHTNDTLLFLNLSMTNMGPSCGNFITDMLSHNRRLIMIHLQGNRLSHEQMKLIQDLLIRNRRSFEEERIAEADERECMADEMNNVIQIRKAFDVKQSEAAQAQERMNAKQRAREHVFVEETEAREVEDARLTRRLEKEAFVRVTRRKKRPAKNATK